LNFATSISPSDNERFSFVAQIANDFEQINGLFDDTVNEICHHIQAWCGARLHGSKTLKK
jgi:hypothetical protein